MSTGRAAGWFGRVCLGTTAAFQASSMDVDNRGHCADGQHRFFAWQFPLMRYPLNLTTLGLLGAAVLAAPVASYAQHVGYATKSVNLRAGPARDYPVVFVATRGAPLQVLGCLNGYQWCDVAVGPVSYTHLTLPTSDLV